jgi:hypothetical protein
LIDMRNPDCSFSRRLLRQSVDFAARLLYLQLYYFNNDASNDWTSTNNVMRDSGNTIQNGIASTSTDDLEAHADLLAGTGQCRNLTSTTSAQINGTANVSLYGSASAITFNGGTVSSATTTIVAIGCSINFEMGAPLNLSGSSAIGTSYAELITTDGSTNFGSGTLGAVICNGTLAGGSATFDGTVSATNGITGGTFNGAVTVTGGSISAGTYNNTVDATGLSITGGQFNSTTTCLHFAGEITTSTVNCQTFTGAHTGGTVNLVGPGVVHYAPIAYTTGDCTISSSSGILGLITTGTGTAPIMSLSWPAAGNVVTGSGTYGVNGELTPSAPAGGGTRAYSG